MFCLVWIKSSENLTALISEFHDVKWKRSIIFSLSCESLREHFSLVKQELANIVDLNSFACI